MLKIKRLKSGDIVQFDIPIIIDEEYLRNAIRTKIKNENTSSNTINYNNFYMFLNDSSGGYFGVYTIGIDMPINLAEYYSDSVPYVVDNNISFSDEEEEKDIVLQRDSFYKNLITGFKWNKEDEVVISQLRSATALRYTTMKFMHTNEIENLKGIISKSGQIEKTVDYNSKWTTLEDLTEYGRSLIIQNSNTINTVVLEFDKNPELNIGDKIELNLENFYVQNTFVVKEISYTYRNFLEQNWQITVKSADLISTYIDIFRPEEKQETEDTIDTIILSDFVEEYIEEKHVLKLNS